MPVASAKAVVPKSWPPCETRPSAFCGPRERRISPRRSVGTLPRSGSFSPNLNPDRGTHLPGQPLARDYFGTQNLATEVRGHTPPPGSSDPRPEGVKGPAIRLKRIVGYRPHMLALFVFPPAVHDPYEKRSAMVLECDLKLRFLQLSPRQPVTAQTVDIDWCNPQFRTVAPGRQSFQRTHLGPARNCRTAQTAGTRFLFSSHDR